MSKASGWQDLPKIQDVGSAQRKGLEIEVDTTGSGFWNTWSGKAWFSHLIYRGRPAHPKKATVTSQCWRNKWHGCLTWYADGNLPHADWQRFPAGDLTGEVEE